MSSDKSSAALKASLIMAEGGGTPKLEVVVQSAKNLINLERIGKSDPYCIVEYKGEEQQTDVINNDLNPKWNKTLTFELHGQAVTANELLKITVKDHEVIGRDRLLGQCDVPLRNVATSSGPNRSCQVDIKLKDGSRQPTQQTIKLKVNYTPPPPGTGTPGGPGIPEGGGVAGLTLSSLPQNLSTSPEDFQVRIRVVEGRQIEGSDVSPVVKVTVSNQTKQTRAAKHTSSPYFDQLFFFNFNESPAELFTDWIEFEVSNAKRFRSNSLIGMFKIPVGVVYIQEGHSFMRKWLLLSNPEDPTAGAKGYLKVTMIVLGPGDEAPQSGKGTEGDDDVESNLLRPAGVQLRPATLSLKVFQAEDIPQMDSAALEGIKNLFGAGTESKKLVDPYFQMEYAGKKVKTKTMYKTNCPEWNEELKIAFQFPSMCTKIKLTLKDWDRFGSDDTIATVFLDVSAVSWPAGAHGFLPSMGPAFINFYGGPREFSALPDGYDDLNKGKGEGVAYRGRVLMQLSTTMGEQPEDGTEVIDIQEEDLPIVDKFMRRRRFRLAVFMLSATRMRKKDTDMPISFEVSVGNFGDILDTSTPPSSSSTQPTNAVFDGTYYYYLPWGKKKPVLTLLCSIEDIRFRVQAYNQLNSIIDTINRHLNRIAVCQRAKASQEVLITLATALLDAVILNCKKPLPAPFENQAATEMDNSIAVVRRVELKKIVEDASTLRSEEEAPIDVETVVSKAEGYVGMLGNLAQGPPSSMPDIMIWMIGGEKKKIAYYRIPAHEVLFSPNPDHRGKFCGKTQTIVMKYLDKKDKKRLPCQLRLNVWFGLQRQAHLFTRQGAEGVINVYAETYQNQHRGIIHGWEDCHGDDRQPWSDVAGLVPLPKDNFVPAEGWKWAGPWFVDPDPSMFLGKDAGFKTFVEEVYEHEVRQGPGRSWEKDSDETKHWTDSSNKPAHRTDQVTCAEGWEWSSDWEVDLNRAVDEEGWEYIVEVFSGAWTGVEKQFHLCRRKRWIRKRERVAEDDSKKQKELMKGGGWMCAMTWSSRFEAEEGISDMVRKRRWHRKMVPEEEAEGAFLTLGATALKAEGKEDKQKMGAMYAPRVMLSYEKTHVYQLRCYLYQGRDLPVMDEESLAGDLLGGNKDVSCDPFCRVSFLNHTALTEIKRYTLNPTWDQTLIIDNIQIHADPDKLAEDPPIIFTSVLDHDPMQKAEYIGRSMSVPMVKLSGGRDPRKPRLGWYTINTREGGSAGQLLAAFELYMDDGHLPPPPPMQEGSDTLFQVPSEIRPQMQRTGIEVLCWGVRKLKKYHLRNVTSPQCEFEIGGNVMKSPVIKSVEQNPNFPEPSIFFDVYLPSENLYMPPMTIKVRDHRLFGRKPVVGRYVISNLTPFNLTPEQQTGPEEGGDGQPQQEEEVEPEGEPPDEGHTVLEIEPPSEEPKEQDSLLGKLAGKSKFLGGLIMPIDTIVPGDNKQATGSKSGSKSSQQPDEETEEDIDWWCKFYASIGDEQQAGSYLQHGYDTMEVYDAPLETRKEFDCLEDFTSTFFLERGKKGDSDDEDDDESVGEVKAKFCLYPLPADPRASLPPKMLDRYPAPDPVDCVVRVYVIRAMTLQPQDMNGLADPYLQLRLGKSKKSDRDNYVPNTLEPVFGSFFELSASIPLEKDLEIRVYDMDLISRDDLIGSTVIDLENRLLTKHRGTCGLPQTYTTDGPNVWRDVQEPKAILESLAERDGIDKPVYDGTNKLRFNGKTYRLETFENGKKLPKHVGPAEQRLALHVLREQKLVPEHVETRPLYSKMQPGLEQGRLQLWVDIFPKDLGQPPPPVDVTPRQAQKYELRVIIWNTADVYLEETSITGEQMSDIYVKGWITGLEDDKQKTDIHYRSLDGTGMFNWRFVFSFEYLPAEKMVYIAKKEHFWSLDKTVNKKPLQLNIQVWDNDKFSSDDWLGEVTLDLNELVMPATSAKKCGLHQLPSLNPEEESAGVLGFLGLGERPQPVCLFRQKTSRGWWPVFLAAEGTRELRGKVEMTLEILTEDEAMEKEAGKGQKDPNMNPTLEKPKRPSTSFLWFTSPFRTLRIIIWRNYKWYIIGGLIILLLAAIILLFMYNMPGYIAKKIIGA
ncbi:PREDICTED: myoferlin-like [Branchiostoma belcheri]|uniref:Myoferlin-like n=1 Tax=Branchiostoma belcheri TaxID=7741 RepID=A0A6P4YR70_BRABE|nr:PREDICTED: myoferlin-like [Branchiostoma belcheri]